MDVVEVAALETFEFGDSPELADELLALVIAGTKTATCGPVRDFVTGVPEPLPVAGQRYAVLDGRGRRAAIIETEDVTIRRFCDVPEDFALAEGEGDFAAWRQGHIGYFTRIGGWSEEMEIVCERFRLIEVLAE